MCLFGFTSAFLFVSNVTTAQRSKLIYITNTLIRNWNCHYFKIAGQNIEALFFFHYPELFIMFLIPPLQISG